MSMEIWKVKLRDLKTRMRRSRHTEEKQLKRHSSLLAIRSGSIIKTSKYLNSKHLVILVAHPQSLVPWHAVFTFLIPVLLGVLQVHCQTSDKSPFETHLPNMLAFLFALLIYCFAYYFNHITSHQLHPTPSNVSANLAFVFGSLASASLISVLVPHHFELSVFIVWIIFLILYFWLNFIMCLMKWLYDLSSKIAASYMVQLWKRILGRNNGESGATIII